MRLTIYYFSILLILVSTNTYSYSKEKKNASGKGSIEVREEIKKCEVRLKGISIRAKLMEGIIRPYGTAYICIKKTGNNRYSIHFIQAKNKEVCGFTAGAMPKNIFLTKVYFQLSKDSIIEPIKGIQDSICLIKNSKIRRKQIDEADIKRNSYPAEILSGSYRKNAFNIKVKLHLPLSFNLIICNYEK